MVLEKSLPIFSFLVLIYNPHTLHNNKTWDTYVCTIYTDEFFTKKWIATPMNYNIDFIAIFPKECPKSFFSQEYT